MIRFVLTLAILATITAPVRAESGELGPAFVHANEAFKNAKTPDEFRQVATLFEALIANGYQNGAVYYNAGNAYYNAGDYGRAIIEYRKAKVYRPRDSFLDANLRQALSVAPGHLPEATTPWWRNIFFWSDWLSYPEKFWLATDVWILGAALASLGLLLRSRRTKAFCALAAFVALFLSIDAAVAYNDVTGVEHAVIVAETTARKGNAPTYEPAFNQPLKDGAELVVKEHRGDWVRGEFGSIGEGWVQQKFVAE